MKFWNVYLLGCTLTKILLVGVHPNENFARAGEVRRGVKNIIEKIRRKKEKRNIPASILVAINDVDASSAAQVAGDS